MKRHAPATDRNREPILDVLRGVLPERGLVLEVASGTGQHAAYFASNLPRMEWQPSDADPEALESIEAWREETQAPNLRPPIRLSATDSEWGVDAADAVVCINMIHIAPWGACEGLFKGAARLLAPGAPLYLYGPFRFNGSFTAPSNEAFDASLRSRDPSWGVRDLVDVTALATANGFAREAVIDMPANNHSIVFRRG
jgi:SAM-dependent methyltransferase